MMKHILCIGQIRGGEIRMIVNEDLIDESFSAREIAERDALLYADTE
jgi:hypothetical protein